MIPDDSDWRKATRAIDPEPVFGFACYEGGYDDAASEWTGNHVGVYGEMADAEAWLRGEPSKPPMTVWPAAL